MPFSKGGLAGRVALLKLANLSDRDLESMNMGGCQNYGPFLGPYYNTGPNTGPNLGDPKRDHNFDNPQYIETHFAGSHAGGSSQET